MAKGNITKNKVVLAPNTFEAETTKKVVLAPNKLIDVSSSIIKSGNGTIIIQGKHSSVKVSALTAKIISKFKK